MRGPRPIHAGTGLAICACILALIRADPLPAAEFGLFGDVTFVDSDAESSPSSFALGGLDLYVLQQIDDKLTGFVELVIEGDEEEFTTEIERLWVRYEVSHTFSIAGGRFHTPIGYWNRAFHHGSLLQDTVDRPFFLDWEDEETGVLPVHLVGLMATGEAWTGIGTFKYEAVLGNGHSIDSGSSGGSRHALEPADLEDGNDDKALAGRLSLTDDSGWQLGVFATRQQIAEGGSLEEGSMVAAGESLFDQTVLGLDLRLTRGRFGVLAELFAFENEALFGDAGRHDAHAYYVQASVDLTPKWRLSYRFSTLEYDEGDPYFALLDVPRQDHNELTLSYRPNEVSVFKIEVDRVDAPDPGPGAATVLRSQWAFLIP